MVSPTRKLEELRELPPGEGAVLLGLAALGLTLANGRLAQTLARAGCFPEARAWAANPRLVQDILVRLRERGLAEERNGFWRAGPGAVESASRLAQERGVLRRLHQVGTTGGDSAGLAPDGELRARAELRAAFLGDPPERWLPLREQFSRQFPGTGRDPLAPLCSGPFEETWFNALPPVARAYGCNALLGDPLLGLPPEPAFLGWLEDAACTPGSGPLALPFTLHQVLQGRRAEARAWLEAQPAAARKHPAWLCLEGLAALAEGEPARAADRYGAALKVLAPAGKVARLPALHAPFHVLALLGSRTTSSLRLAREQAARLAPGAPAAGLVHLVEVLAGAPPEGDLHPRLAPHLTPLEGTLAALAAYLAGDALPLERIEAVLAACEGLPLGWFAGAMEELLRRQRGGPSRPCPLLDLVPAKAPWEKRLDQLVRLGEAPPGLDPSTGARKPRNLR
jgi:hypothetical protein